MERTGFGQKISMRIPAEYKALFVGAMLLMLSSDYDFSVRNQIGESVSRRPEIALRWAVAGVAFISFGYAFSVFRDWGTAGIDWMEQLRSEYPEKRQAAIRFLGQNESLPEEQLIAILAAEKTDPDIFVRNTARFVLSKQKADLTKYDLRESFVEAGLKKGMVDHG